MRNHVSQIAQFMLLHCFVTETILAFHHHNQVNKARSPLSTLGQGPGPLYAAAENNDGSATLLLTGKSKFETKPLAMPKPADKVLEFFEAPEYRNLLVSAGGTRPVDTIQVTPKLLKQWNKACDDVGAQQPSSDDTDSTSTVLSVITGGIKFPGLELTSKANIGMTYNNNDNNMPTYEFTLINDERSVKGLPPAVWLYNKLTGGGDDDDGEEKETSTKSLSTVTYNVSEDDKVVFSIDAVLTIVVKFPAFLLKILPTNKQKAEESGGASIQKVLDKDIDKSFKAFEKAYESWLLTNS